MADIIVDGKTRVYAVPTVANPASLTVAEIAAGEPLHEFLIPTGLAGFEGSTAEIDSTPLASAFDTKLPGRTSFSGTSLTFKKQSGTDAVFDLLSVRGVDTNVVIFDGVDSDTTPAAGEDYDLYPVRTGEFEYMGRGEANSLLRWMVPTPVTSARVRGTISA